MRAIRFGERFTTALLVSMVSVIGCSDSDDTGAAGTGGQGGSETDFTSFVWNEINGDAPWSARAGLHVVALGGRFYLMGGRTPIDSPIPGVSELWSDVWVSEDEGGTWEQVLESGDAGHWAPRAYFQAVTLGGAMFVMGGQDFGFPSNFFSDVWRSTDGVSWTEMTPDAGWAGRAGLRAVVFEDEIYIFGGSQNDDDAIIGPGGPARIYFNDVWKSADGATWELVTDDAPWEPRAGAVVVVKDGAMFLLGGEDGFLCEPQPDCEPPYFNDVWRSTDGATWEPVTASAGWSPRPGHQCAVAFDNIVCFGGFGLPENPSDVWVSPDGESWTQVSDSPWNAESSEDIKYDFEAFALDDVIYTFGGDRETFDFTDPDNFMRVDNDVWRYAPPSP